MASKSKAPGPFRVIWTALIDWWDGWLDMVLVTALWFFAQITIILGPPATFGVYYVVYHMQNGEALGVRGMIEGARKYFGKSLIWGVINLLVLLTLYINVRFYSGLEALWGFYLLVLVLMLGLLWFSTQFYALPYFMEQEVKKLRIAMKNGLLTSMAAPIFTFLMILLSAIIAALSFGFIIPLFLGLPAIIPMLGFRAMYNRLEKFGLRTPEKSPKEIEFDESGHVDVPSLDRSARDAVDRDAPGSRVTNSKGQVEQEK